MNLLGPIGSFISSVTWAVGSTTYSLLSKKYPPSVVNFNRAMIALPLYVLGIAVTYGPQNIFPKLAEAELTNVLWLGASQISSFAFGDVLFLMAAHRIGVPMSLTLASIYPVWSALAGWLFKNEDLVGTQWLGLLVIVGGVIAMIRSSHSGATEPSKEQSTSSTRFSFRIGLLLAFATSFMWAFNTYGVSEGASGISTLAANTYRMLFALPLCWIFGIGLGVRGTWLMKKEDYRSYGFIFAFEACVGSLCFTYGLSHSPLAVAAALSSLSPLLAVPLAVVFGDEKLNWKKTGFIALVTLGIIALVNP